MAMGMATIPKVITDLRDITKSPPDLLLPNMKDVFDKIKQ
jgi:hypothetical protein